LQQVDLQLSRKPKPLPKMKINPKIKDIAKFTIDDFVLVDYDPDPAIYAPIAV
jgi:thymidylate synthase